MLVANSEFSSSILPRSPLIPNPVETLDESIGNNQASLSTEEVSLPPRNSDEPPSAPLNETLIVSSPLRLEHGECSDSQVVTKPINHSKSNNTNLVICLSDSTTNRQQRSPNVSPGSDTDVDSENKPLRRRFRQEPPKIVESTRVGAGLLNLGNSCFINSVLQCFTHTVPLIESLYSYQYQDPCTCNERFCVIGALRYHIGYALATTSLFSISPIYFFDNLNYFSPDFRCYQQEDAHEFLHAFLNKLEICCLNRRNDVNFVQHIFGGRLVSELRCCNCNYVSETFEDSLGLSLEIEDFDNLQSALDSFTRVEKLEEQMTCDNCDEKVSKEKQLLLHNLPQVITFHLKRFKNNGYFMMKNYNFVEFPLELDLLPYMSNGQVATKYYLYALVKHYGSLAYGHYSSFVRSAPKIWHKFNDKQVTRVDEDFVLQQNSYILFYARDGTQWFSTAIEELHPMTDEDSSSEYSSQTSDSDHTNEECSSEISSENVSKKGCGSAGLSDLLNAATEESFVSDSDKPKEDVLSEPEEFSDEDSYSMELLVDSDDDSNNSCTEKEADSSLDIEKATSSVGFSPDSSSKQPEGSFRIQLGQVETTKNQEEEESCKEPLLIRSLMKKPPPRDRELDEPMSTSGSAQKKIKTS
ncbi:ubiquitin carboxyl-terminal hydrolase 20 [Raphanus sativus]|uniref:Ubiquitin carboxyl-terminal hydrolase n=1 Tax=Raphanus sativus TaxID=3726 RepID=A0A6J0KPU9_RAPSA|nr:ubiquitin carboxyl-terminal hydrolase 20 [Raphanus sativus]